MHHQPALVPARRQAARGRVGPLQPQLLNRGVHGLLDQLCQRQIQPANTCLRLRWFQPARLRRHRAPAVVELDVRRRLRDRLHHSDAILRVPDLHADVQCLECHAPILNPSPSGDKATFSLLFLRRPFEDPSKTLRESIEAPPGPHAAHTPQARQPRRFAWPARRASAPRRARGGFG